jgi:hypothetical protein
MTKKQQISIRCACADLLGAIQAHRQLDPFVHDWESHLLTIQELMETFPFLDNEFGHKLQELEGDDNEDVEDHCSPIGLFNAEIKRMEQLQKED